VGELWDQLSGKLEQRSSEEILRRKMPAHRGLSAETYAAVEAGELVIDDDDPQAQMLADSAEGSDYNFRT